MKSKAIPSLIYILGFLYLLTLPPWEGYDEAAHFSYIETMASELRPPQYGKEQLSERIISYAKKYPLPYTTIVPLDAPYLVGAMTYYNWGSSNTKSSQIENLLNWQSQQPPFFYAAMLPIYWATSDLSIKSQLISFRVASWSIAFLALLISANAISTYFSEEKNLNPLYIFNTAMTWPIIVPEFFPEFARLGNDSLVFFLFSILFSLILKVSRSEVLTIKNTIAIGVISCLGMLTKASFAPIFAAIIFSYFLLIVLKKVQPTRALASIAVLTTLFLTLGLAWYYTSWFSGGSLTGLDDFNKANATPISILMALSNYYQLGVGLANTILTFSWGGTTSSAYPPVLLVVPLTPIIILIIYGLIKAISKDANLADLSSAVISIFFVLSLIYYIGLKIVTSGSGVGVPGWYIHTICPVLIYFLVYSLSTPSITISESIKAYLKLNSVYSCLFLTYIHIAQIYMYAGCVIKSSTRRTYSVVENHCSFDIIEIAEKISPLLLTSAIPLYLITLLILFRLVPKSISSESAIKNIGLHPEAPQSERV